MRNGPGEAIETPDGERVPGLELFVKLCESKANGGRGGHAVEEDPVGFDPVCGERCDLGLGERWAGAANEHAIIA